MGIVDNVKQEIQERKEGYGFKTTAKYLGGHPSHPKEMTGTIKIKREGLVFNALFRDIFTIPYGQITSIASDTADRIGLGRMLMVGIFAFAWKKKDKFLKISYKDETGFENSIVFGKLNADEWRGLIVRARQSSASQSKKIEDEEGKNSMTPSKTETDQLNQLEKLSELKKKGILTDAEFQAKKKQILDL